MKRPFWETKTLEDMNDEEWESLCDGCALCCLHKMEDEDTGDVVYSNLACRLLDTDSCRCTKYSKRTTEVPDCLVLAPHRREVYNWLPASCAYRRLSEGKSLPGWHPLITGDPESVHKAGISVRGKAVAADDETALAVMRELGNDES